MPNKYPDFFSIIEFMYLYVGDEEHLINYPDRLFLPAENRAFKQQQKNWIH
jgi:hypothetical protein